MLGKNLRRLFGSHKDATNAIEDNPAAESIAMETAAPDANVYLPADMPEGVVAAIAAAIAAIWTEPTGFIVRRIRRVPKYR